MSRFFHDDEIGDSQSTADGVRWLRENAPEIVPGVNTFSDSGPETLYRDGQFIYSPEQYAVNPSGDLQCNASGYCNGTTMTNQQLVMFANDQLLAERYRLDGWPLFSVFDGNSDGFIDRSELGEALEGLCTLSERDVTTIFEETDTDNSGLIDL